MKTITDLHIHSRYSRATSESMCIGEIARFAKIKGLSIVGTGDFTHPKWLKELHEQLIEEPDANLYKPVNDPFMPVYFMVTGEVATIFNFGGEVKKVHHLILTPSLETAAQINDRLSRYGSLEADGRPILDMSAPQLVEEVMAVSGENEVIPAHVWTPWFSVFGAFSGFDRIEDCYQDMTGHIHALETGLSSDPPMNWRLSSLDKYTLVSNSDSHSFWPWRMGREANVFELNKVAYREIVDAIRRKDVGRFKFTIETDPAYGKYHWTGHRNCGVSMPPKQAIALNNRCPVCHRRMTLGVEQRVEELADRPQDYHAQNAVGYMRLLPLSEVIATVTGASYPSTQKVWGIYNALIGKFGNEYNVLIDAPEEEMVEVVEPKVADAVMRVREKRAKVIPGYDGVYGQLVLLDAQLLVAEETSETQPPTNAQRNLTDFM